jgi:acyl carrier protein
MDRAEIIEKTNDFLIDEFEVDGSTITPDANLKDTLGLDSLDYVDLVVAVESNFGVKLGEADFAGVATFGNFYDMIGNKIKAKELV